MSRAPAGRDWVALTLAIGAAIALNMIALAAVWDSIRSASPGLSENATQILTGAFGGFLGVLGSYVGYRAGASATERRWQETRGGADDRP